jgi:hypothetical protein
VSVLLADRTLGLRRQSSSGADGHGDRIGRTWGALEGPHPGRAEEQPDTVMHGTGGRTWVIALDDRLWPVTQGDMIVDADSGVNWLVTSADLLRNNADPSVDYVRVEAHTLASASGGTIP